MKEQLKEKKEEQFFVSVRIHKDDIRSHFTDQDKEKPSPLIQQQIDDLTDDEMRWIATKLCDSFCETGYYSILGSLFERVMEDKKL